MELTAVGLSVVLGAVGAFTRKVVRYYDGEQWNWNTVGAYTFMGGVVGLCWTLKGLPNHFNTLAGGYFATSIIHHMENRLRNKYQPTTLEKV